MTTKLSAEIENEIEKNAAAERAEIAAAAKLTDQERAAISAEYWQFVKDGAAKYEAIVDPAEKDAFISGQMEKIAAIGVRKIAVDFIEWAHATDATLPGLGDALIAGFLATTGIGSLTFKRDTCRPIVWQFQENAKKAERAERARIATEKLEKRIAAANARGMKLCGRCGGAGGWKGWPGFTCYDCDGAGFVPMTEREKKAYAKTIATIAAK